MRDNRLMNFPRAFVQRSQFEEAISKAGQSLAPNVVKIIPTLRPDWTGDPAVFLVVILTDSAAKGDQRQIVTSQASRSIDQEVEPLEQWGVLPYFSYRSQSEQMKLEEVSAA